jgi:hypothetical protein
LIEESIQLQTISEQKEKQNFTIRNKTRPSNKIDHLLVQQRGPARHRRSINASHPSMTDGSASFPDEQNDPGAQWNPSATIFFLPHSVPFSVARDLE